MSKTTKPLWERITRPRKGGGRVLVRPLRGTDICKKTFVSGDGRCCAVGWSSCLNTGNPLACNGGKVRDELGKTAAAMDDNVVRWSDRTDPSTVARTLNCVFRRLHLIRPEKGTTKARGRK